MAATSFTTTTEPRVLGAPAGQAAHEKGRALLDPVLKPNDLSPNARFVVQSLAGRVLVLGEHQAGLAKTLDSLAEVCERMPARLAEVERRLRDLEGKR